MLKSKNHVTLFVNYSCNSFCDFCFSENTFREQKIMCQKLIWDFRFYMGVIYIYRHTFNRYLRDWCNYFYTPPMATNELHWCLLNLLVKSLFIQSLYNFIAKVQKSLEPNFVTLNPFNQRRIGEE